MGEKIVLKQSEISWGKPIENGIKGLGARKIAPQRYRTAVIYASVRQKTQGGSRQAMGKSIRWSPGKARYVRRFWWNGTPGST